MKPIFKIFLKIYRFALELLAAFSFCKNPPAKVIRLSSSCGFPEKNLGQVCIKKSFFYSLLFSLILIFSIQNAFAVKKDQNQGAEEGKNHKEQSTEKPPVQVANLPIEEGKNNREQSTETSAQAPDLPIEKEKNYQTKQTEKTSAQAPDLSLEDIKKSQSLNEGRKSASHSFRPLLIQGKKRLVQKAKDMKVDSGNIAESELFFIDIDFKKRIFEYEENK